VTTATPIVPVRAAALRALRETLWARGFLETDTPQLVPGPGLEPHIDPLAVDVRTELVAHPDGAGAAARLWLITSPELALKRVVAGGIPRVFQLGHVFRDGEHTRRHVPEFTLLEWYRGPGTLDEILDDTLALIRTVAAVVGNRSGLDLDAPPERLTLADAFARLAGVDLTAAIDETAAGDSAALARRAVAAGIALVGADSMGFDDAFFAVMDQVVEPGIGHGRLCVLERWPATMAVLARRCDDDPRFARRFELYGQHTTSSGAGGCLELCNAFDELRDPIEQRARFDDDNATRARLGRPVLPLDEDFLAALPSLPAPTAGNALGVDRVLMLLLGAATIDDVLAQPFRFSCGR
jgi:elongation factor P--(R)-beta-lysine ligase